VSSNALDFTADGLRSAGFVGFKSIASLRESKCAEVPSSPGVYMVLRTSGLPPQWLETSTGGWFKKRNPTVAVSVLEARLIQETPVVYIGKADVLRKRLRDYLAFGSGKPVGHWGGRYIWQLGDADDLIVAWKVVEQPGVVEGELLRAFSARFGALPFANLRF